MSGPAPAAPAPTAPPAVAPEPSLPPIAVADPTPSPQPTIPSSILGRAEPRTIDESGDWVQAVAVPPLAGTAPAAPAFEDRADSLASPRTLARLVSVNRDGSDGQVHEITEESWDLGQCDGQLTFTDDPYLSRRHCRFSREDDRWIVRDLGSLNGIYLRIREPVLLEDGDLLLLGKEVLRFELVSEHERGVAPAVEHGTLLFGSPLRTPWGRLRQITVAGSAGDMFLLHQPQVVVGREEGDLLFTDDQFMSRRHLQITLDGDQAWAEDLGSSNGTFQHLSRPTELFDNDLLRIGDQLLRFERTE